jgi:cell division protein FtsB
VRLLVAGLVALSGYFALFGGEHSALELREARRDLAMEAEGLDGLRQEIDSMAAWADSLETDPGVLERLARERFGMVREDEILYLVVPAGPEASDPGDSGS